MAGDVLNATTDYYYPAAVTNNHNSLVTDIVGALVQAITGSSAVTPLVHGSTTNIGSSLNASVPFANIADPNKAATDNIPRAYLNVMFFDERFNFVEEGSTALRVSQAGDGAAPLVLNGLKAPKNGYAYIYVSNENDDAVYFDNFTVSDTRGRIIEEDHYYAFGLKIAGISSVKFGDPNEGMLANKNLYNDKELFDDADLNWYDYGFRNYDAQIGRFPQLDPLTWDYPELTNYQYASNDPILNIDLDGLEGVPTPGGLWNGSFLEQGVKAASSSLFRPILTNGLSIGSNLANNAVKSNIAQKVITGNNTRYADKVIEEALNKGKYFNFAKPFGLFATLMLTPIETGKELSPKEWYEKIKYTNRPNPIEELKNNGPVLYRFDTRSPFEITEAGGFKAWGLNFNIMDHVSGKSINNKTSGYVSTSRTREGALDLWKRRKNGYLYRIKFQLTGIDVSTISKFPHQAEVAVPLIIFPSDILGAEKLSKLK